MEGSGLSLLLSIVILILGTAETKLSDQRLCADEDCSVLVSVGKTMLKYYAKDQGMLSFGNNKQVKIFSKGAGSNPDLWGVMIDGKRGYVNKNHLQEQRVFVKDLVHTLPSEYLKQETEPFLAEEVAESMDNNIDVSVQTDVQEPEIVPSIQSEFSTQTQSDSPNLSPQSTPPIEQSVNFQKPDSISLEEPLQPEAQFEVVDGTTFYFDDPDSLSKINEAPSHDNATPEAISPTMTHSNVVSEPTETQMEPGIEGSVTDDHKINDNLEPSDNPVVSDNPGTSSPTESGMSGEGDARIEVSESKDHSDISVEVPNTATYEINEAVKENGIGSDQIKVDKPIVDEEVPYAVDVEGETVTAAPSTEKVDENDDEIFNYDSYEYEEDVEEVEADKLETIVKEEVIEEVSDPEPDSHDENATPTTALKEESVVQNDMYENKEALQSEETTQPGIDYHSNGDESVGSVRDNEDITNIPGAGEVNNEMMNEINAADQEPNSSAHENPGHVDVKEHEHGAKNNHGHSHGQGNEHNHGQGNEHNHGHSHGQGNDHNHGHAHGYGQDDEHNHGHSHGQGNNHNHGHAHSHGPGNGQNHGHAHSHGQGDNHNHGHAHDHGHSHGHGHSHDHEGHDHSHGMGHLGKGYKVSEEAPIPDYYKPAEQTYDLPLSAQFGGGGGGSEYNYQYQPQPQYDQQPETQQHQYQEKDQYEESKYEETTPSTNTEVENASSLAIEMTTVAPVQEVLPPVDENVEDVQGSVEDLPTENTQDAESHTEEPETLEETASTGGGIFSTIFNMFGGGNERVEETTEEPIDLELETTVFPSDSDTLSDITSDSLTPESAYKPVVDDTQDSLDENIRSSDNIESDAMQASEEIPDINSSVDTGSNLFINTDSGVNSEDEPVVELEKVPEDNPELISDSLSVDNSEPPMESIQELGVELGSMIEDLPSLTEDLGSLNEDLSHSVMTEYAPDWLHVAVHESAGFHGDRLALVGIVALTLVLLHLVNTFMDRGTREKPLIKRLSEMDKKLFASTNELLILKKQMGEKGNTGGLSTVDSAQVRELEIQLEQTKLELVNVKENSKKDDEGRGVLVSQLEIARQEVNTAQDEARQSQEMVEELLNQQKKNQEGPGNDEQLMEVVGQLQAQLESQRGMLGKYEPKLKKKEKENRELSKEVKQLRADVANANLEADKIRKQFNDNEKIKEDLQGRVNDVNKNEDEWKSLSDLLQTQLDEKSELVGKLEDDLSTFKSRVMLFKSEADTKDEEIEVLRETLETLQSRNRECKSPKIEEESNGWDVEQEADIENEGWEVEDIEEVKKLAQFKVENKKLNENKKLLEEEIFTLKNRLEDESSNTENLQSDVVSLREARDQVVGEHDDTTRKLEVLTEFFNKKEAELQKQLGLQSAKFGDVASDSESQARQLVSVNQELEATQGQLKLVKSELEDQERSLRSSVAQQEKKAHENWVAARQAERKLHEVQQEMSLLRNRLTQVEGASSLLESEKADLSSTVSVLQGQLSSAQSNHTNGRPPSSLEGLDPQENNSVENGSAFKPISPASGPESLPRLPGLPELPGLASATQPLASMAPLSLPGLMNPMLTNPLGMMGGSMVQPTSPPGMFPGLGGMGGIGGMTSMGGMGGMAPSMMDSRPPPLGRMSPAPRDRHSNRSYESRSPSPEYDDRYGRETRRYSVRGERSGSPSSRSERRISPARRPSPTRSERGSGRYERQYEDRDRSYRQRQDSPERYSNRSDRSDRNTPYSSRTGGGGRHNTHQADYLKEPSHGPKTSSPMEPQQVRNYGP